MSIARDFYITDDRHFLERFFLSLDFINALLLRNFPFSILRLLIVPYGIETANSPCVASYHKLLIVPYGIETSSYRLISIS